MSSNCEDDVTSIGAACAGNTAPHFPHFPVSARFFTGIRLMALHWLHTRRMSKCYRARRGEEQGCSKEGSEGRTKVGEAGSENREGGKGCEERASEAEVARGCRQTEEGIRAVDP